MAELSWCLNQKKGIKLIEPNDNLFTEYVQTAEETLEILKTIKGKSKVWLATTKYYCEYFSFYALLMKVGIKCEIHECTIKLCKVFEELKVVPEGYSKILDEDKQLRIDNQYYLKNREVPIDYDKIVNFVITLKSIGIKLSTDKIEEIRKRVKAK